MKVTATGLDGQNHPYHTDIPTLLFEQAGHDVTDQFDLLTKLVGAVLEALPAAAAEQIIIRVFPTITKVEFL